MATFADFMDAFDNPNDKRYEDYRRRLREDPLSVTRKEALAARYLPGSNELAWDHIPAYRNDFDREVLRRELKEKKTDPVEIEKEVDRAYPHFYPTHLYTEEELEDKKNIGERLFEAADKSSGFPRVSYTLIQTVVDNYEKEKFDNINNATRMYKENGMEEKLKKDVANFSKPQILTPKKSFFKRLFNRNNKDGYEELQGGSRKQRKQNKRKSSKQNKRKSSKRRA